MYALLLLWNMDDFGMFLIEGLAWPAVIICWQLIPHTPGWGTMLYRFLPKANPIFGWKDVGGTEDPDTGESIAGVRIFFCIFPDSKVRIKPSWLGKACVCKNKSPLWVRDTNSIKEMPGKTRFGFFFAPAGVADADSSWCLVSWFEVTLVKTLM